MLAEWHEGIGDVASKTPTIAEARMRGRLIQEETKEVCEELYTGARVKLAKELSDLAYVVYGAAWKFDIPLEEVLAEVHRSNMTKLQGDHIYRRADGKILKPPTFEEADVESVLAHAGTA
jgi:predicted HAD superfamily Cof-like phosphohydrolase